MSSVEPQGPQEQAEQPVNLEDVVSGSIRDEDRLKTLLGMVAVKSSKKSSDLEDKMIEADYAANHARLHGDVATTGATSEAILSSDELPMDIMSAGNVIISINKPADAPAATTTPPTVPAAPAAAAAPNTSILSTAAKVAAFGLAATGIGGPIALALPSVVDILTKNNQQIVQPATPAPAPINTHTEWDWQLGQPSVE